MDDRAKKTKIDVPDPVSSILARIRRAGYEAYVVGGCVRDRLLGREPEDWDITTSALPVQIKELFSATVDTGIQHGTVMVLHSGCGYEVTTYRIDGEYKDGRHPESVTFTPNLEEDLKRRDFTINAFAYDPEEGVIDLFGGLNDLKNGIIRAVGDPRKRFDEDALRIMRAVRFAAQLSFDIEEETENAISEFAPKLAMVSRERIRVEFEKTLYSKNPSRINDLKRLGLASYIIPDHSDECFDEKALPVLEGIINDGNDLSKVLRLAVFFENLNESECADVMRKMTFDNKTKELVSGILKFEGMDIWKDDETGVRKALHLTGPELYMLCLRFKEAHGQDISDLKLALALVLGRGDAYSIPQLNITGTDLIEDGFAQGVEIGKTLNKLLDMVIEDPTLNNKDTLKNILLYEVKK